MITVFKDNSAEDFLRAEHKVCVKRMEIKLPCTFDRNLLQRMIFSLTAAWLKL
jgi:hypothetical protein